MINKAKWFLRAVSWKPSFKLDRNLRVIFVLQLTYLYQGSTDIIYLCRCMWLTTANDKGPALYFTCIRELTQTLKMISIFRYKWAQKLDSFTNIYYWTGAVPNFDINTVRERSIQHNFSLFLSVCEQISI